ncbi:MAG: hypothetical protein ACD_41C00248G0001 [uncultured bacterium]|nr:MAG: hypothetical protein ACD_41C00248G0001 [uncultured bacterium]
MVGFANRLKQLNENQDGKRKAAERKNGEREGSKSEVGKALAETEAALAEAKGSADEAQTEIAGADSFVQEHGENLDPEVADGLATLRAKAGEAIKKFEDLSGRVDALRAKLAALDSGEAEEIGKRFDTVIGSGVHQEQSVNEPHGRSPMDAIIAQYEQDRLDASQRNQNYRVERDSSTSPEITVYTKDESGMEVPHRFTIEVLDSPEHPTLPEAYALLQNNFDPEELDSLELVKDQMRGLRCGYEMGAKISLFAIKDENGEVITTLDGGLLPLLDEQGNETGEKVFGVFYVATDDKWKKYGLGREIMLDAYRFMEQKAKEQSTKLIGATGECTWTSQRYWENLGWRRVYGDDGKGVIEEIRYTQPPLEFDLETGEVEEGSGEAPEHFMVHLFDKSALADPRETARRLTSMCRAIYRTNNYINEKAFKEAHPGRPENAKAAYENHLRAIKPLEESFAEQLKGGRPIGFYSEAELIVLAKKGREVVEAWGSDEEKDAVQNRREIKEVF